MAGVNELDIATYMVNEGAGITRYRAVVEGSSPHEVSLPESTNDQCLGIAKETRGDSQAISIVKRGRTYVIMGASCSAGDFLYNFGTDGKLKPVPTNATPQHYNAIARAEEDSSGSGDVIIADVNPITIYS